MPEKNVRLEVMQQLEPKVDGFIDEFLIPVEKFGNLPIFCQTLNKKLFTTKSPKLEN